VPVAHVLPAVLHVGFKAAQAPFVHTPPQHWLSSVQTPLSETHASLAHFLSGPHWKLQQSAPVVQFCP
jgi:hypothetical protein